MRSLILGNGSFLVTLDATGGVRDIYFPHVGLENHVGGKRRHRVGVFVDGAISWLADDPRWQIKVECEEDSLVGRTTATNAELGVELLFQDTVYNESSIFLRHVIVKNLAPRTRELKLYFGQEFEISHSPGSDTAYFDPTTNTLIHYKGQRAILVAGSFEGGQFSDYSVGLAHFEGKEGSFRDAEDGLLSKNPIEHGSVDSMLGFYAQYEANEEKVVDYWLCAGDSVEHAIGLHQYVLEKTPEHLHRTSGNYWRAWINRYAWNFHKLSPEMIALFNKSLMFVRAHVDDDGGIIASADSDTLQYGEDTYAYVWPRDAAYAACALNHAGETSVTERFFMFCNQVITEDGYFMHKYLPDRSLGSSWEPWIRDGKPQLPIQEDETALVVYMLAKHYESSHDLEFIEKLYNPVIEKAANFMADYRDSTTGLPKASYDLWEEKHGASTFTCATVYGGLSAAADIAKILGKQDREQFYRQAAQEVREGILTYLVDRESGGFVKLIEMHGTDMAYDRTVDFSSVYGVFAFGVLPVDDPMLAKAFEEAVKRLSTDGGIARYEGDRYHATSDKGNPWIICTLWYAEYLIARAKNDEDLAPVREIFEWVVQHALPSGILSEQVSATDGSQLSVAPLTWSHAEYANAVLAYLDKLEQLGISDARNPTLQAKVTDPL